MATDDPFAKEKCRKCAGEVADNEIWSSKKMQQEYQKALKNLRVKTGSDVQAEVKKSLAKQGYKMVTQGTTDSSGEIKVEEQEGPCAKLIEKTGTIDIAVVVVGMVYGYYSICRGI